jgi:long-chain-fatty-acid--[acyl-carrier-protein] ligase
MLDYLVTILARFLLWLRYDIKVTGLDKIAEKGTAHIAFLPNHPALIDPVMVNLYLRNKFKPRSFADQDQVDRFFIRYFSKRWGVRTVPSLAVYGPSARKQLESVLTDSIEGLKGGENLLLWPAGRLYRSHRESLGANSAVERIMHDCPKARIVLVRTRGLWGSKFSWAWGTEPLVLPILLKGALQILANFVFFTPRRHVTIELYEPHDLPRKADRNTFNAYLENWYNEDAPPAIYVPYTIWQRTGRHEMPDPELPRIEGDYSDVPENTRTIVLEHVAEMTGYKDIEEQTRLAADLGMDSLSRTDLTLWLETEFGIRQADADAMQTVGDVMLAACGKFVYTTPESIPAPHRRWSRPRDHSPISPQPGDTITQIFLREAARDPSRAAIADKNSGVKTYRNIITACMVLKPRIEKLEGDYIGIMLPASVAADVFYLATMFAGKVPVMVNWTAGPRNIHASLDAVGVRRILTARLLVERIAMQGIDLSEIADRFVLAEDLGNEIPKTAKLKALLLSYVSWRSLRKAVPAEIAAVIFTSGSETLPKAVPLTHKNIVSCLRSVVTMVDIYQNDRLIGFIPPFHSFGLTVTMVLPLCGGAPVVYHPNPTESDTLAKLIDAYDVTVLVGTPTFLGQIVRVAEKEQLASLRLAVTGAEKCPDKVYQALAEKCENATVIEGYGVTECSPIISLNDDKDPRPGTIGKIIPTLDHILIDPETSEPLTPPATGVLLVAGPSVFGGYLNYEGKSPFTEIAGRTWYSTGDIVHEDTDHRLTFTGRLKRFVKLGGEMVSLPAIEAVLQDKFASDADEGPTIAVDAAAADNPELVLFTTLDIDRETANTHIRQAGLSGLHSIRKVIKLDEIPVLGTGKTNYRQLKKLLT